MDFRKTPPYGRAPKSVGPLKNRSASRGYITPPNSTAVPTLNHFKLSTVRALELSWLNKGNFKVFDGKSTLVIQKWTKKFFPRLKRIISKRLHGPLRCVFEHSTRTKLRGFGSERELRWCILRAPEGVGSFVRRGEPVHARRRIGDQRGATRGLGRTGNE